MPAVKSTRVVGETVSMPTLVDRPPFNYIDSAVEVPWRSMCCGLASRRRGLGATRVTGYLALATLGLLWSCACGGASHPRQPADSLRLATWSAHLSPTPVHGSSGQFGMTARIDGTLQGRVNSDGTACLWLSTQPQPITLIWPTGWFGLPNPLRATDPNGHTVGVVGEQVAYVGGLSPYATDTPIIGCGTASVAFLVAARA